jgi:hypothetical protein
MERQEAAGKDDGEVPCSPAMHQVSYLRIPAQSEATGQARTLPGYFCTGCK